jgi:hypothetical protein
MLKITLSLMLIVLASGCALSRCGACCDDGFAAMVPGLLQKIYGRDPETASSAASTSNRRGRSRRLRRRSWRGTNREAYQVESARMERYEVLFTLYPGIRAK